MIDVSIVIVCMNNLKNLYPCLESIHKYTTVSYETLVVAYLFSEENLKKVKNDFPWVSFIESNEIRGFSENNNLALRQAKGKYCFVVNDDTEVKMDTIGKLTHTFDLLPSDTGIVSPKFLNSDGSLQLCGKRECNRHSYFRSFYHLPKDGKQAKYINQSGVFLTKQILGAGFMIRTDLFKQIGWFDERYFFAPEDLEVARQIERKGFKCYVNSEAEIYHFEGMTSRSLSMVSTATKPASVLGTIIYYGEESLFWREVIRIHEFLGSLLRCVYHLIMAKRRSVNSNYHNVWTIGYWNAAKACFCNKTPKEVFIHYYKLLTVK